MPADAPPLTAARSGGARARRSGPHRPERQRSELRARILVALPAIAIAVFLVVEGGAILLAGLFVVGGVCMHELFTMYERARPVLLGGLLALAGLLIAAQYGTAAQVLLVAVAAVPVVFGLILISPRPSVSGIAVTLLGIYWIGFALAHAVLLRNLPHGMGIVLDVLVGTFMGDTGAYFGGKLVGRRRLAPKISPNKTVEGLIVGMFLAIAGVWLASRYQVWLSGNHALVLGAGVAVLAPVGDLFESFVKRDASTKDAGSFFGAHGGALDRLDAVLFTIVISYYIWSAYV